MAVKNIDGISNDLIIPYESSFGQIKFNIIG